MNIVHAFKLRRWEGTYYYIMELVEGRPLDEADKEDKFSLARSLAVVRDVAAALDYIHSKRYVHRDIKPGNVLIRPDGHVKVLDFGLAQKFGRVKRTKSGHVMGTAKYMAPELIQGTEVYAETDIYALGIIAYELDRRKAAVRRRPRKRAYGHAPLRQAQAAYRRGPRRRQELEPLRRPHARQGPVRGARPRPSTVHSWLDFYVTKGWFAEVPRSF